MITIRSCEFRCAGVSTCAGAASFTPSAAASAWTPEIAACTSPSSPGAIGIFASVAYSASTGLPGR